MDLQHQHQVNAKFILFIFVFTLLFQLSVLDCVILTLLLNEEQLKMFTNCYTTNFSGVTILFSNGEQSVMTLAQFIHAATFRCNTRKYKCSNTGRLKQE